MLKRPRARSPSPTRPDPSSPPPLDNSSLPFRVTKRRRSVGPTLDGDARRGCYWNTDDGEDDYEYEGDPDRMREENTEDDMPDKMYKHMNNLLHNLHAEQQQRLRAQPTHLESESQMQSVHMYRGYPSPTQSPVKFGQQGYSPFPPPHFESVKIQEGTDSVEGSLYQYDPDGTSGQKDAYLGQDYERLCVTRRYEDTNRVLGSLVLSRRRTLEPPPLNVLPETAQR